MPFISVLVQIILHFPTKSESSRLKLGVCARVFFSRARSALQRGSKNSRARSARALERGILKQLIIYNFYFDLTKLQHDGALATNLKRKLRFLDREKAKQGKLG